MKGELIAEDLEELMLQRPVISMIQAPCGIPIYSGVVIDRRYEGPSRSCRSGGRG